MSTARKIIEELLPDPSGRPAPKPQPSPEPAKSMEIGDILAPMSARDQELVTRILNRHAGDVSAARRELGPLLDKYAAQLEAIGIVPAYAAYAIPYAVYRAKGLI